jgi:hypothetical protein
MLAGRVSEQIVEPSTGVPGAAQNPDANEPDASSTSTITVPGSDPGDGAHTGGAVIENVHVMLSPSTTSITPVPPRPSGDSDATPALYVPAARERDTENPAEKKSRNCVEPVPPHVEPPKLRVPG